MEDFVTYEQAEMLCYLGFDWECNHYYDYSHNLVEYTQSYETSYSNWNYENHKDFGHYSAPTLAQVRKWLGEVKGVNLVPNFKFHKGKVKYSWYIVTDNGDRGICDDIEKSIYDTYEKALSAGIDRAIELLKDQKHGWRK